MPRSGDGVVWCRDNKPRLHDNQIILIRSNLSGEAQGSVPRKVVAASARGPDGQVAGPCSPPRASRRPSALAARTPRGCPGPGQHLAVFLTFEKETGTCVGLACCGLERGGEPSAPRV